MGFEILDMGKNPQETAAHSEYIILIHDLSISCVLAAQSWKMETSQQDFKVLVEKRKYCC